MNTLETMQKHRAAALKQADTRIMKIINFTVENDKQLDRLEKFLPEIENAFEKLKLEITSFSFRKSGRESQWEPADKWHLDYTVKPLGKKKFFIAHDGYKACGEGRNRARLEAKAQALEASIQDYAPGVGGVSVNKYSLEDSTRGENRVLVSFWV